MRMRKRWRTDQELLAAYEEGGQGIGRTLMHDKEKEPMIWKLISGTSIWPRWYLAAFRSLYIAEHQAEYQAWKHRRWWLRRRARETAKGISEGRRRALEALSGDQVI